jgi:multidrug efflux pump subunit AcrB
MLGFSLNLVSFLGITLATGILVDDAIVEIENIARHMRMGKSAYRASMDAADEIGLAVIAITFTIVAVFVPVSFMGGIVGQYFKQFGMTVAVAVLFSLLVARLITPMLAAYFMRSHGHEEELSGPILRAYIKVLKFLNWAPKIEVIHPRSKTQELMWFSFALMFFAGLLLFVFAGLSGLAASSNSALAMIGSALNGLSLLGMLGGVLGAAILLILAAIRYRKDWRFYKPEQNAEASAARPRLIQPRLFNNAYSAFAYRLYPTR